MYYDLLTCFKINLVLSLYHLVLVKLMPRKVWLG